MPMLHLSPLMVTRVDVIILVDVVVRVAVDVVIVGTILVDVYVTT